MHIFCFLAAGILLSASTTDAIGGAVGRVAVSRSGGGGMGRGRGGMRGSGRGGNQYIISRVPEKQEQSSQRVQITRASHFYQAYKLGFKIKLICIARGNPRPSITWYKHGVELELKRNLHLREKKIGEYTLKSKIEIDPATVGDQGVYTCKANNPYAEASKHFKTEYYF